MRSLRGEGEAAEAKAENAGADARSFPTLAERHK